MSIRYLDEIDTLNGKKVFIRVDFNVPLDDNQNITEDTRIRAVLPTINYALDSNAKVILASHLGRPKGPGAGGSGWQGGCERLQEACMLVWRRPDDFTEP